MKMYKIKPLDWIRCPGIDEPAFAHVHFGAYAVGKHKEGWRWGYSLFNFTDVEEFKCNSLQHGMDLAEVHWIEKILPCLETLDKDDLLKIVNKDLLSTSVKEPLDWPSEFVKSLEKLRSEPK